MVVVASTMALSMTTGTKSADQVSGTYQFVPKGVVSLWAKGSATGVLVTLLNNGLAIINDQAVINFGTTGTMTRADNLIVQQTINGGRLELYFRNPTGGTLTVDYLLEHIATK